MLFSSHRRDRTVQTGISWWEQIICSRAIQSSVITNHLLQMHARTIYVSGKTVAVWDAQAPFARAAFHKM